MQFVLCFLIVMMIILGGIFYLAPEFDFNHIEESDFFKERTVKTIDYVNYQMPDGNMDVYIKAVMLSDVSKEDIYKSLMLEKKDTFKFESSNGEINQVGLIWIDSESYVNFKSSFLILKEEYTLRKISNENYFRVVTVEDEETYLSSLRATTDKALIYRVAKQLYSNLFIFSIILGIIWFGLWLGGVI